MDLDQCLYISRFTGKLGVTGLRDLLQQARDNNRRDDITGALLFDGDRFVQLIQGPKARVGPLTDQLRRDGRHAAFQLLLDGPASARLLGRWTSGYVDMEEVDRFVLAAAEAPGNAEALLRAFGELLHAADLE